MWQAIDNGVTAQTSKDREKYWAAWSNYATQWRIDAFLQNCEKLDVIIVVAAFATWVRTGYFGRSYEIKVPTVAKGLAAITTSIRMVGQSCPFKETEEEFVLPIKQLVEGLQQYDPPPIPQLAVPVSVLEDCCKHSVIINNPWQQATGDLINIDFYYLLRCGEYTAPHYVWRKEGT